MDLPIYPFFWGNAESLQTSVDLAGTDAGSTPVALPDFMAGLDFALSEPERHCQGDPDFAQIQRGRTLEGTEIPQGLNGQSRKCCRECSSPWDVTEIA